MQPDPRKALASTVRALMVWRYGKENKTQFGKDTGINVAGAQRALSGEGGFGVLERIAAYFKLQPWQLLVPGFDPRHPPQLAAPSAEEPRAAYGVELSDQEQELIGAFRSISDEQRTAFHQDVISTAAMLPGPLRTTLQEMVRRKVIPDGQADPQHVAKLADYPKEESTASVTSIEAAPPRRSIHLKKQPKATAPAKRKKA